MLDTSIGGRPPSSRSFLDSPGTSRSQEASAGAQAQLAHAGRVAILGEMSASIVHEVNQPLAAIAANAAASLRWLTLASPNLHEAIAAMRRIIGEVERASEMIERIRSFVRNGKPDMSSLDINAVIDSVIALVEPGASRRHVSLLFDCTPQLAAVYGDRVQVEQVIVSLMVNGIEAMASLTDRSRELVIRTRQHDAHTVLVAVQDVGIGTDSEDLDQLFGAFYSTKSNGMGMGLTISRSIIEAHQGQIWAIRNSGPGMTFQFTLPTRPPS